MRWRDPVALHAVLDQLFDELRTWARLLADQDRALRRIAAGEHADRGRPNATAHPQPGAGDGCPGVKLEGRRVRAEW